MISSITIITYLFLKILQIQSASSVSAQWISNNYFISGQFVYSPSIMLGYDSPINKFVTESVTISFNNPLTNPSKNVVAMGLLDFNMNLSNSNLYLHLSNSQVNDTEFEVSIELIYKWDNYFLNKMKFSYLALDSSLNQPFQIGYFINVAFCVIIQGRKSGDALYGPLTKEFLVNYTAMTGQVLNLDHENVLVAFLHVFDISNVLDGCFDFNIKLEVYNISVYKATISTTCAIKIQKFGFSRIIFDRTKIQNNGYYFIEYGLNETMNVLSPQLTISVQNYSISNFMMGINSFTISNQLAFEFASSLSQSTTINASLTDTNNQNNFSYFYIRYRECPSNFQFFQLSTFLCFDSFPAALAGCLNGAEINSKLFCYQCQNHYVLSDNNDCMMESAIQDNNLQKKLGYVLLGFAYFICLLSLFSSKIISLQLMGLYQLAYLILVDQPLINPLLRALLNLKYSNGYNFEDSKSVQKSIYSVKVINYSYSFLQNVNLMFGLVLSLLLISLLFALLSLKLICIKKIAQIFLKSVFLYFFIFNLFNMSFSLGLHLKYANQDNSTFYMLNLIATIVTLFVSIFVLFGLTFFENMLYGQYRTIFKQNFLMRKYIFLTIIKRFLLGFSMSYFNENENVALILLSISFCFALYSISNLPFAEVYHNYRSNFCHITELTIIFAAYYYRRVGKKDVNNESISQFSVALIQILMLMMCLGVAIFTISYEIICKMSEPNLQKINTQILARKSSITRVFQDNQQVTLQI